MALKVKDELVGKRFICFEKSSKGILQTCVESNNFENGMPKVENISAKRGVIRATTSKDVNEDSHQILVEYDDQAWETREWLATADQLCLLMVEDSLVWIPKEECHSGLELNKEKDVNDPLSSHVPALIFKQVHGDIKVGDNFVLEILQSKKLLFHIDSTFLRPFKEEDLKWKPSSCKDVEMMEEVEKWWDVQNGQNILLNMPLILVGFRVQVYRTEGATQWFTAVIRMVDENSQTLIILDDTVLEEHHVSPSLVQMSLIGEGVVTSLLNGDHVKIRPSRTKISANVKNCPSNCDKKRKKSVVKEHPKKHKTKSPTACSKLEANHVESDPNIINKKIQNSSQSDEKNKFASCKSDNLQHQPNNIDYKACNKGENHSRSIFKSKQKLSSSSSSSSFSSSSSPSSESSESGCRKNRKLDSYINKNLTFSSRAQNGLDQLKLSLSGQNFVSSITPLGANNFRKTKSLGKLEKNKKSTKGVIFLTEEEEELIQNKSTEKDRKILPKCIPEQNSIMDTMPSDSKAFIKKTESGSEHHDKPVDLSSSTSSSETKGIVHSKKVDRAQTPASSEHYVSISGASVKPIQTVFPTICQDKLDNKTQSSRDKSAPIFENLTCPLAYNVISPSARNLIPLGYIPFLINSSMKVIANPLDQQKSGTSAIPYPAEQVAALVGNTRLLQQLQANGDDIYQIPPVKPPKTNFSALYELGLLGKEDISGMSRDEKNARKESKFVVHEPERPGEAVNHHFNKSLVRQPFGSQPAIVPGVMLSLPSHMQPLSILNKSSSSLNLGHMGILNPQIRTCSASRGLSGCTQSINLDSHSLYTATKSTLCNSNANLSSNSMDSLKPTLDLSGNVYLPTASMLKSPDAFLSRLQQQEQLHEYIKLHAQQLQQQQQQVNLSTQNHLLLNVTTQAKQMQGTNKDVLETPTSSLLVSNKVMANQNLRTDSMHSKIDVSSGALDLQKKQAFPLIASTVSKSSHAPLPLQQFWSDKVPLQDQQALLSSSIIVLDYQGLKGMDQSLVSQLSSNSSGTHPIGKNMTTSSMQNEMPAVTNGKKRTSEEAMPLLNAKKLKVTDRFMDVTSLLFCGSERKVTSPQLGFLPQSSPLNGNHKLQNGNRIRTPDLPSIIFQSIKESKFLPGADENDTLVSQGFAKQENMKSERMTIKRESPETCTASSGPSKSTNNLVTLEAATPSLIAFTSSSLGSHPNVDRSSPRPHKEATNPFCTSEDWLPKASSSSSMKCISSPESSRDHAMGTDSETRSACSPFTTRSIGGTPTFSSSLEVNDSSPAVCSSSVCSSGGPVKFKKAWLRRYDEDSRNDSLSSTENIFTSNHVKCSTSDTCTTENKSDIIISKSYDVLNQQDIKTPSTSAVEDSDEAWTSENEMEEGKSVASHCSKTDQQDSNQCLKENSDNNRFECLEKMKGRLRELRVTSRRDDPSAILSSQVLNHISKEKRSETLEPFLQDGSCHEVTPRLIKCRECRAIKNKKDRKAPNDFCRFYAFRRLRYISKRHLSVSGFSDLSDVTIPDMELWFPTLPVVGPLLDQQVASYLLIHLREPFSKIVKAERMAETWCSESISNDSGKFSAVWKRAVQGVKEMCDVCDMALFNIHCVCNKCGFAVCISCHREKVYQMKKMKQLITSGHAGDNEKVQQSYSPSRSEEGVKAKKSKGDRQNDSNGVKLCNEEPADRWLTCHNKQQLHDPLKLMVAQTIPSDVLWYLDDLLEKYFKNQTPQSTSLPFLSSAFDRLAVLADVAERQIQQDENQLETQSAPQSHQQLSQTSPFLGSRKFQEPTLMSNDVSGLTSNSIKFNGKCISMLQKERLLHVTDASAAASSQFLCNFQKHWSKGLPVVVSKCNLDVDLWRPDQLYRTLTRSDPNHSESFVDSMACRRFWEGFEKVSARAKHGQYGLATTGEMLSPVFTWGSAKDEFRDMLPNQFQNLAESLPIGPYTSETGQYNLTSRLPEFFAKPDLGPHLLVGYAQLDMLEGSLPLKLEGCDMITLLACVVTPKDDVNNHLSAAEKYLMKIGCGLKLSDTATKPGVVWHMFERQYNDIIEKLVVEKQMKISKPAAGSLSKPPIYLTLEDIKSLKREHNIDPITVVQHLDDAVFIPAGCYRQARFLHGCVMASVDVVSPENTNFMLNHQLEANFNCSDKLQLLNTIYHATKDSLAVMMQSEMLSHCH